MTSFPNLEKRLVHEDDIDRAGELLQREADRLLRCVEQVVAAPICAIAFLYTPEDDPLFSYAYAWSAADREGLGDTLEHHADAVWQPADWDIELDVVEPDAETVAAANRLAAAMEDEAARALRTERGEVRAISAARPFLRDLSRHLNGLDWSNIAEVTEDFVVWANEHELSELSVETFRAMAPTHVFSAYKERGWTAWLEEHGW